MPKTCLKKKKKKKDLRIKLRHFNYRYNQEMAVWDPLLAEAALYKLPSFFSSSDLLQQINIITNLVLYRTEVKSMQEVTQSHLSFK